MPFFDIKNWFPLNLMKDPLFASTSSHKPMPSIVFEFKLKLGGKRALDFPVVKACI